MAEHGDRAWNALEQRMHELMVLVMESNSYSYALYGNNYPFNLDPNELREYSVVHFNKRLERIRKAREQTLEEINNVANSMDEATA